MNLARGVSEKGYNRIMVSINITSKGHILEGLCKL
jgi:hypothetical protein